MFFLYFLKWSNRQIEWTSVSLHSWFLHTRNALSIDASPRLLKSPILCCRNQSVLQSSSGCCLSFGESGVAVGCANGVATLHDPILLDVLQSLPRPHCLGTVVADAQNRRKDARYPDCAAIYYDEIRGRIVLVYNDHSLYVWDVSDPGRITIVSSHFFHSRCVWGLDVNSWPDFQWFYFELHIFLFYFSNYQTLRSL